MRYFVKLDKNQHPVPGSLVYNTTLPKKGRWFEIIKPCLDEDGHCIQSPKPDGYFQKLKFYYLTDCDCQPIAGSNVSAYCKPTTGNYIEYFPTCLIKPCNEPVTTTTTTVNINDNLSFYYGIPVCLLWGPNVTCSSICNSYYGGDAGCTTFYTSPLCSIDLQVGCILYLDNTYTTQVPYTGTFSNGKKCYSVTNGVVTSVGNCPPVTTTTTTIRNVTNCSGVYETVRPPISVNGNLITSTHTGTIFEQGLGPGWGICSGRPELMGENAWLGFNAFTYTIHFSNPVNNIALRIECMGVPCNETYTFTTNAGTPTITSNFSCYATITGNQITGGLGSSFGPISGGGGEFVFTTPSPYTSITITGTGECSGSLFGIVCSSI